MTDRVQHIYYHGMHIEADVAALREKYPDETDGMTDREAVIDAYANDVGYPFLTIRPEADDAW